MSDEAFRSRFHPNDADNKCAGRERRMKIKSEINEKWAEIGVQFEPDLWRRKYREDHVEKFNDSVEFLQNVTGISQEDAEEKILNDLIRITFVEKNLIVNGQQHAEQLFANLLLAINEEQEIPFKSAQELADFCDSMPLNFRKDAKLYRNTGVQGRRLIQELKRKLTRGDVIDCDSLDQIFENFRKTIHVDEELKNFTEQEAQLDYSSLFYISKTIPGFVYDKASGRLGLSPDADKSLLLNAPIFTDTINSSHPLKLDLSRTVDACAINACTTYPDRQQFYFADEHLRGVRSAMFWKKPPNRTSVMESNFTSIHGCISPNNPRLQVETFRIEPTKLCLVDADFERAKENIDKQKSQSFEKFFAVYGNLNKEEAGEDQKETEAADDV
ncbi:hypothetical protein L5515_018438 [Caenorhabditis briggsae]|uniref:Uncharacterized protein n=1 Tax=Caenorhabditis briggsae TaxID=6238 RepID=A0AAE9FH38_CAEBR|nr:hypothetical protein L5515_018438 [Caenorhabditis briggsae]